MAKSVKEKKLKSKEKDDLKKKKVKSVEKTEKKKSKSKDEKKAKKAKTVERKPRKKKEVPPIEPVKNKMKALELYDHIAAMVDIKGVERKEVRKILEALGDVIKGSVMKKGVGEFAFPKLFKVKVVDKPATKARKGINRFTGEEMMFKAKPASRKVKILSLKGLKDAADPK